MSNQKYVTLKRFNCIFITLLFLGVLIFTVVADNPEEQGTYFEGDIKLPLLARYAGTLNENRRWPANIVPYEIDPKFPSDFKVTFLKAINHIMGRTCIRFKERSNEADYIYVTQEGGCYSFVGRIGNEQTLSLGKGCWPLGTHIHELMHALGFNHEQSRPDRDEFVTINWENINPGSEGNFNKHSSDQVSAFGVSYDYNSIMHYSKSAFSKNGEDTISPKDPKAKIGQREKLSDSDIKQINMMYCPSIRGIRIKNVADAQYLQVESATKEGNSIITWNWNDKDTHKWTVDWSALRNIDEGTPLISWSQDGGRIKVMDEDLATATVIMWGYRETAMNQRWSIKKISESDLTWQLINRESGKCLYSSGLSRAKMVVCDEKDAKQLWNIYVA